MNSKIMMITTTNQSIDANGIIPLTTIARRTGCILTNGTNNVLLNKPGYYKIDAMITFTASASGNVEITIDKNSESIPGLIASTSVTTADTELNTLNISGIVRVFPIDGAATISLINSGIAITSSNVALSVEAI